MSRRKICLPRARSIRSSIWKVRQLLISFPARLWLRLNPRQRLYHLFVLVFTLFMVTNPGAAPALIGMGDDLPTILLPVSIILERDFDLDEFIDHPLDPGASWKEPYWMVRVGNHYFSRYPVLSAVLVTPFYLLPVALGFTAQSTLLPYYLLGKTSAALLAAGSVVLVYLSLRFVASELTALCLSFVYAFASPTWTISSQALWQHAASQLFLAAGIYCLLKSLGDRKAVGFSGLFVGLAIAARPTNLVIALIFIAYLLHRSRDRIPYFLAGTIIPLSFLLWYNHSTFGSAFSQGYAEEAYNAWTAPFPGGLWGILFSPSKGLLVYSPVFWFSIAGILASWRRGIRDEATTWLLRYLGVAVVSFSLMMSKWHAWAGGWSFGSRMLVDIAPLLILLIIPALEHLGQRRGVIAVFAIFIAMSIAVQLGGLSMFDAGWYRQQFSTGYNEASFWSIRSSELAYYINRFGIPGFFGRILGQGLASMVAAVLMTLGSVCLLSRRGLVV